MAEFFAPGPGERLRAARLSMGFDLAKIASELHLTGRVVEALEADEYEGIGARVFVRGYLRNYARIVGMPVESILRQFDEKWPDEGLHQTIVRQSPRLPADGGPSRGWAGLISWLVVIALVALFLMWWRGYLDELVPEQIRSIGKSEETAAVAAEDTYEPSALLPLGGAPSPADGSLRLPAPPPDVAPESEPGDTLPMPPPPADVDPRDAATDGGDSSSADAELPLLSRATPAPTAIDAADPAVPLADDATVSSEDGGAPVIDGTRRIVLTFNSACWVDVRDSERRFKLFGEMPKGTRKVLGGEPPYKLVIGNAHAVSITVNGEPFDLMPYAKGNVARFTLDP